MNKIKVNNTVYECFEVSTYDASSFSALVKADSMEKVKTDFISSPTIVIINNIGQIVKTLVGYTVYGGASERPEYYVDEDGALKSAIQITMNPVDVSERIKMIEEKIDDSVNEADMTLEEYQEYRIKQSKEALAVYLETHPLASTAHGGIEGVYSITKEKQDLMSQQYLTYQIMKQVDPENAVLTWNETGKECTVFTEAEFVQLIMEVKNRVYPLVSYQQSIEAQIRLSNDKAEISAMTFDYDNISSGE